MVEEGGQLLAKAQQLQYAKTKFGNKAGDFVGGTAKTRAITLRSHAAQIGGPAHQDANSCRSARCIQPMVESAGTVRPIFGGRVIGDDDGYATGSIELCDWLYLCDWHGGWIIDSLNQKLSSTSYQR